MWELIYTLCIYTKDIFHLLKWNGICLRACSHLGAEKFNPYRLWMSTPSSLKEKKKKSSLGAQLVKNPPAIRKTLVQFLSRKIHWRRDRLPTPVFMGFPGSSGSKDLASMQETWAWSPGWEGPPEKKTATHSSVLDWKIPWREEPNGLQSLGSQSQTWLRDLDAHTTVSHACKRPPTDFQKIQEELGHLHGQYICLVGHLLLLSA